MDYMHCILLGVCRTMLRLWLQSSNHQCLWYIGTRKLELDERLLCIQPPCEMQRTPRSIESTIKFWKGILNVMYKLTSKDLDACTHAAHEIRAWLLHYSAMVLHGILPDNFYQHYLLLVEATFLLLQTVVTNEDIKLSYKILKHFCFMFAPLYGKVYGVCH